MSFNVGITTTTMSTRQVLLTRVSAKSKLREFTRRVTRTATLDGGAVLTDQGFSDGDRTLVILATVDLATAEACEYLLRNYATVVVTTKEGCFLCALSDITPRDGQIQITALVQSRLSEA